MLDVMFDVPSSKEKKKVITLDYAKERMKNTNWESLRDA
jgi:ATP-dependent protease Clp ATPase subunit